MPKIRQYTSEEGYYLQTSLSGAPVTLQISPDAEALIEDLGYGEGDDLPREILKPLILLEEIFTKSGSTDKVELYEDTPSVPDDGEALEKWQQSVFREFLQDRINQLVADYSLLREHLNNKSTVFNEQWEFETQSDSDLSHQDGAVDSPDVSELDSPEELANIPEALRALDQWVGWKQTVRDGKPTKIPVNPESEGPAKVNDSETWMSFTTAVDSLSNDTVEGLGFVFTDGDTIAGVDLDDVRDPDSGNLDEQAEDIIQRMDSYTEVSPSGTGVHVLVKGFKPPGRTRDDHIEMYDRDRYFTVTGQHLEGTPLSIEVRQDELRSVHADYLGQTSTKKAYGPPDRDMSETASADARELPTEIQPETILERAKRNDTFQRLWNGDYSEYPSHSEADMALCCSLAYRTGGNTQLMDELFRQSGLMRPKWDADRGDQTYGELTLQKALQFVDDVDPYLTQDEPKTRPLSELEPDETATVEVEVTSIRDPPVEEQSKFGRVMDQTKALRFVRWQSDESPATELVEGKEYRLENVWVTTFDGRVEIHINEHTSVVKIAD